MSTRYSILAGAPWRGACDWLENYETNSGTKGPVFPAEGSPFNLIGFIESVTLLPAAGGIDPALFCLFGHRIDGKSSALLCEVGTYSKYLHDVEL